MLPDGEFDPVEVAKAIVRTGFALPKQQVKVLSAADLLFQGDGELFKIVPAPDFVEDKLANHLAALFFAPGSDPDFEASLVEYGGHSRRDMGEGWIAQFLVFVAGPHAVRQIAELAAGVSGTMHLTGLLGLDSPLRRALVGGADCDRVAFGRSVAGGIAALDAELIGRVRRQVGQRQAGVLSRDGADNLSILS